MTEIGKHFLSLHYSYTACWFLRKCLLYLRFTYPKFLVLVLVILSFQFLDSCYWTGKANTPFVWQYFYNVKKSVTFYLINNFFIVFIQLSSNGLSYFRNRKMHIFHMLRVRKMLCLQVLEDLISQSSDKTLSDMTKKNISLPPISIQDQILLFLFTGTQTTSATSLLRHWGWSDQQQIVAELQQSQVFLMSTFRFANKQIVS